jgi:hypothetical protein
MSVRRILSTRNFIFIVAALASWQLAMAQPADGPKLGLVVTPKGEFTHENVTEAFQLAQEAGAEITRNYVSWTGIETSPREFDWRGTDYMLNQARAAGLRVSVAFQVIRTAIKEPRPTDLERLDWESPKLIRRFSEFVIALLDRSSDVVDYVEIGSEINGYLFYHQGEIEPFRVFYQAVYENIKAAYPDVSVGTVFAYVDLRNTGAYNIYDRLSIGDHDGFTVYLLSDGFQQTSPPSDAALMLEEIADLTGDRPFAIEEIGWSTDAEMQGSELTQRQAVDSAFDYLESAGASDRLEFITWYAMHDMDYDDCYQIAATFGDLEGEDRALFARFLCSFGLRDHQGNARSAWNEWVSRAAELRD